eukprot:5493140-Prymnesium_polylepis.1
MADIERLQRLVHLECISELGSAKAIALRAHDDTVREFVITREVQGPQRRIEVECSGKLGSAVVVPALDVICGEI